MTPTQHSLVRSPHNSGLRIMALCGAPHKARSLTTITETRDLIETLPDVPDLVVRQLGLGGAVLTIFLQTNAKPKGLQHVSLGGVPLRGCIGGWF